MLTVMRVRYSAVDSEDGCDNESICDRKNAPQKYLRMVLWLLTVIVIAALYIGGVFTFLLEEDFTNYSRALKIDNFRRIIDAIDRNGLQFVGVNHTSAARSIDRYAIDEVLSKIRNDNTYLKDIEPLSQFHGFNYLHDIEPSCLKQWGEKRIQSTLLFSPIIDTNSVTTITIVVKSAVNNYARRRAIRNTWYLNQTVDNLIAFRTIFMVGGCDERNPVPASALASSPTKTWSSKLCKGTIQEESSLHGDIIQSSAIDTYYNNTIKTFMTFRWIVERCPSDFTLTIDDDFVFEVDNFVRHLKELVSVERSYYSTATGLEHPNKALAQESRLQDRKQVLAGKLEDRLNTLNNFRALSSKYLYTGYLRNYVHPFRTVLSKWYVSCQDYAYNRYPPFISGGSVLMSFKTVKHFYLSSHFARTFPFDDVYVGMLAYKLGFLPEHNENFMCSVKPYLAADPTRSNATSCIGVHDIEPNELVELWERRKKSH